MLGQRGHREPPDVSRPNHHLRVTWHSIESKCKSRPVEGIAVPQIRNVTHLCHDHTVPQISNVTHRCALIILFLRYLLAVYTSQPKQLLAS